VNSIWRRNKWNHLDPRKWGSWRILNKGHLTTPIFNYHRTLVCEMIK
jgi:hypothetical protein